ncbi:MAG: PilZ domain-containing protein [Polyangiales bacterium]
MDDRRSAPRMQVFLAAEIETKDGRVRSAVSRDASATGLLLLTRGELTAGETVKLHILRADQNAEPIQASGKVIRSEPLDEEEALIWRHKLAIALEDPPEALIDEMKLFSAKQKGFYGSKS